MASWNPSYKTPCSSYASFLWPSSALISSNNSSDPFHQSSFEEICKQRLESSRFTVTEENQNPTLGATIAKLSDLAKPILHRCPLPSFEPELLYEAVKKGDLEMTTRFLDQGFPASIFVNGISLLYTACEHGRLEVASLLLARGANVTARNDLSSEPTFSNRDYLRIHQATPMKAASAQGDVKLLNLLIQHGAPMDEPDPRGTAPVCTAAIEKQEEAVLFFIERGVQVVQTDAYQNSLLALAVRSQMLRATQMLVKKGVDVTECNEDGRSCLYDAARGKNSELLIFLLKQEGVKELIDVRFLEKWTPLAAAVCFGHLKNVHTLVAAGADLLLRYGKKKRTILEVARKILDRRTSLLERHPGDAIPNKNALYNQREIVKFLRECL